MRTFSVYKKNGEMVVVSDKHGNYRAQRAVDVKRALTDVEIVPYTVLVKTGNQWVYLSRKSVPKRDPLERLLYDPSVHGNLPTLRERVEQKQAAE